MQYENEIWKDIEDYEGFYKYQIQVKSNQLIEHFYIKVNTNVI